MTPHISCLNRHTGDPSRRSSEGAKTESRYPSLETLYKDMMEKASKEGFHV